MAATPAPALTPSPAPALTPTFQVLMELIKDTVPAGVINVVTGYGTEAGAALTQSKGIAKVAFTGSTPTGTAVLKEAAESLIPVTVELGGKSPNIVFSSVMSSDDAFLDKAVEGAVLFALNQGEVCTQQSRLLVQEEIYVCHRQIEPKTSRPQAGLLYSHALTRLSPF